MINLRRSREMGLPTSHRAGGAVFPGALLIGALLLSGGVGLSAQPATGIESFDDAQIEFSYIPSQTFEIVGRLDITQSGSEDRDFFIVIDGGQAGSVDARAAVNPGDAGDSVEYQLLVPSSGEAVRDFSSGVPEPGSVLSGTIPGAQSGPWRSYASVDLILRVQEGQLEDSEPEYADDLEMRIYYGSVDDPGSYDAADPEATASLSVRGNVDPFVQVALVDPGASYPPGPPGPVRRTERDMDFGVLEAGDTRRYDLLVDANTLFSIVLESAHNGALALQDTGGNGSGLTTSVPYRLRVDGVNQTLASGPTEVGSALSGFRWEIAVEILDFGVPVAGDYEDVITITVSADQ